MKTRAQVDALVNAIDAADYARANLYDTKPSDLRINERVRSLAVLREIAAAIGTGTYREKFGGLEMEAIDYKNVHFFATVGRVD